MRVFRTCWYRYTKLNLLSPKYLLVFLFVYFIYNEFTSDSEFESDQSRRIARDPHHRNNHEEKSHKILKKKKKKQKKLKKEQKRFEDLENRVENVKHSQLESEPDFYSDDDIADGNIKNDQQFVAEMAPEREIDDFRKELEHDLKDIETDINFDPMAIAGDTKKKPEFPEPDEDEEPDLNKPETTTIEDTTTSGTTTIAEKTAEPQAEEEVTTTKTTTTTTTSTTTTTTTTTTTEKEGTTVPPEDVNPEDIPEQDPMHDNSAKLNKIDYDENVDESHEVKGADDETANLVLKKDNSSKLNKIEYDDHVDESHEVNDQNEGEETNEDVSEDEETTATSTTTTTTTTTTSTSETDNSNASPKSSSESSPGIQQPTNEPIAGSSPFGSSSYSVPVAQLNNAPAVPESSSKLSVSPSPTESNQSFVVPTVKKWEDFKIGNLKRGQIRVNEGPLHPEHANLNQEKLNHYLPYDSSRGEPKEPEIIEKRNKIKEMMLHAWNGYTEKSWGASEVNPQSGEPINSALFGKSNTGLTIIDAIGTLYIMGMEKEYQNARDWIESDLHFDAETIPGEISFFESNIRHLGGLLSIYQLTGDSIFLDKAEMVGDILEFAYGDSKLQEKTHGLPYGEINPAQGYVQQHGWASGCFVLAEFGTILLEWTTLSYETGESRYGKHANDVNAYLRSLPQPDTGAWPNLFDPIKGRACSKAATFGGPADSFYEYIVKYYILSGQKDTKQLDWWKNIRTGLKKSLVKRNTSDKEMPVMMIELNSSGHQINKMGHLACFAGGFWGLSSKLLDSKDDMDIAEGVTQSCRTSYQKSKTKIGPEAFNESGNVYGRDSYYILRPETVESYFYMWRMTKNQKYRDWAWDFVQALEAHCRSTYGYAGLKDVNSGEQNTTQESFFLAETLKYLYLIFSDDDLISLDEFVFTTEAHPLYIRNSA